MPDIAKHQVRFRRVKPIKHRQVVEREIDVYAEFAEFREFVLQAQDTVLVVPNEPGEVEPEVDF